MPFQKHKQYRLPGHHYSSGRDYFITVCTKNKIHHFGKIIKHSEDFTMELSAIGCFVNDSILSIPLSYKDVTLGQTVVMPNHMHLILNMPHRDMLNQQVEGILGLTPLMRGSVSSIINHLKGKVTKWSNSNGVSFAWQARFHDHIIRDSKSYDRISNYIASNVWNWENDQNNV